MAETEINLGTAAAAAPARPEQQPPVVRTVDRPDCMETFADSVTQLYFDGQSLRMELSVTRLDEPKPNTALTARRTPAMRLVLSPLAAAELINRLQQIGQVLAQAGVLKTTPQKQA